MRNPAGPFVDFGNMDLILGEGVAQPNWFGSGAWLACELLCCLSAEGCGAR